MDPDLQAALPLFDEVRAQIVAKKTQFDRWKPAMDDITRSYANAKTILDSGNSKFATQFAANVKQAIQKAEAVHVDEAIILMVDGNQPITYGQIKAKVAALDNKATSLTQAADSAATAKMAPYVKLLSGDKLRIFKEQFGSLDVYNFGHGGQRLTTPQAFAQSDLWASYGHDRNGIQPRWKLDIWHFKGMKLVNQTQQSGWGEDPPSSAFK